MRCEKCGREFEKLYVNTFARDGSDYKAECEVGVYANEAVEVETTQNWCGYELTEEEMIDTITCPHCGKFPFESTEIHVYDIVQVVMFRKADTIDDCIKFPTNYMSTEMAEYIEREALLEAISKIGRSPLSELDTVGVVSLVANQPAADVAPVRRGHWIKRGYACGEAEFECSLCGEIEWRTNETDYCPNCGAKMME